jgi:hypothetical protein
MTDNKDEWLDPSFPDQLALNTLALINLAWARVDAIASAALCSQLSTDPFEFSILVGRVETVPKAQEIGKNIKT